MYKRQINKLHVDRCHITQCDNVDDGGVSVQYVIGRLLTSEKPQFGEEEPADKKTSGDSVQVIVLE